LGSGAAPQALQAGLPSVLETDSIDQAAAAMVTGANCRLAQAHISGEASKAGVTLYRSLFIQARGVLKKELLEHLRARRTIRRSRHASLKRNGLGQIKNAVSISERPPSVEDRAVPGHWEGDLIGGSRNSYIATLVERHSRYVMLVKVANKDTESVVSAEPAAQRPLAARRGTPTILSSLRSDCPARIDEGDSQYKDRWDLLHVICSLWLYSSW
jgi:IS30 family transposase